MRTLRPAGGRRRYDALTRSLCARLTYQHATIVPIFLTGKKLPVGQLEKLNLGLRELRRNPDVELHERVDLRAWTTLGVGGVSSVVARCHSAFGVREVLDLAASHGIGWVCLGGGSRLIAPDHGFRVPVVSVTGDLARWEPELDGIIAGAGANLAQVCRATLRSGLSGIESIRRRDHSIGGLVRAAVDGVVSLGEILDWIEIQRPGCDPERWRSTIAEVVPVPEFLHRAVVTKIRFRLRPSGLAEIKPPPVGQTRSRAMRSTHPVFLDSRDASAADLLAEAGCINSAIGGVRLGGPKGNELIAGRSATSMDVLTLCRRSRDRVLSVTGIELASALVFVDEEGQEIPL